MSIQPPRFLGQHDRNAVADRIGELGGARDQFLLLAVVFERALGQRAHENFEKLRIDTGGGTFGHIGFRLMAHASTSRAAIAAAHCSLVSPSVWLFASSISVSATRIS